MNKHFFITGCIRSGTTLLEKLLCNHHSLSVLAQPFPSLYIQIKQLFLRELNITEYFALSHYVNETRYNFKDFNSFLNCKTIPNQLIIDTIKDMYSGRLTKSIAYKLESEQYYGEIYKHLTRINSHNKQAKSFACKEVLCEEFVPYFITNEIKVLHILRDPRDVISSIKKGKGEQYIGNVKPLLFELRNWRKSAQLAIQFKENPQFLSINYEDLVLETDNTLQNICEFLGVVPFKRDAFSNGIREQNGKLWSSNSSFNEVNGVVSTSSIGKHKSLLSNEVNRYISVVCYPELKLLGDTLSLPTEYKNIISSFSEPVVIDDPNFKNDANYSEDNAKYETFRLDSFLKNNYEAELNYK
ncbi:MAG: sulfotransferase [Pseudomonadales bacterium]|nr:sulfotransferase [Pseudomonadales bacterium]